MTVPEALDLVVAELTKARSQHHTFHSGHEGYAVIREEVDELWDAIKADKQYLLYGGTAAREAVQVAAMALRFLVDLCDHDSTAAYIQGRNRPSVSGGSGEDILGHRSELTGLTRAARDQ